MKKKMIIIASVVAACSAVAALLTYKRRSYGSLDPDTREFDDYLEESEGFEYSCEEADA